LPERNLVADCIAETNFGVTVLSGYAGDKFIQIECKHAQWRDYDATAFLSNIHGLTDAELCSRHDGSVNVDGRAVARFLHCRPHSAGPVEIIDALRV
jgi:hypothetical protein